MNEVNTVDEVSISSASSVVSTESTSINYDIDQSHGKDLEYELKQAQDEIMELRRKLSTFTDNNEATNLTIRGNILTTRVSALTEDEL